MSRKKVYLFGMLLIVLLLVACAGPNTVVDTASPAGSMAGFWAGLWHGIIAPIAFIISLFNDNVSVYEVHNRGSLYDLGFVLGIGGLYVGGSKAASNSRRR